MKSRLTYWLNCLPRLEESRTLHLTPFLYDILYELEPLDGAADEAAGAGARTTVGPGEAGVVVGDEGFEEGLSSSQSSSSAPPSVLSEDEGTEVGLDTGGEEAGVEGSSSSQSPSSASVLAGEEVAGVGTGAREEA